jgi:cell division protein FtsL
VTRLLNLVLVGVLVAAAMGVYSIKYESTRQAERVSKLRRDIEAERIAIATLRAEWAHLSQPERLEALAKNHLDLAPMRVEQIVKAADLPAKSADDAIEKKLEGLGLTEPAVTGATP